MLDHYEGQSGKKFDGPECRIPGCDLPRGRRRWCQMHYTRYKRHGDPLYVAQSRVGYMHTNGYRMVAKHGHPLADASGTVYEHRLVLYAILGDGPHPCHWCRKPLNWGANLHVDHLDDNPVNNTPANLVPSCSGCNIGRERAPGSERRIRTSKATTE